MKTGIHPTYYAQAKITCSCGNVIATGSTREEYTTELCSKCHPFYTGKKKTVDSAGRIEMFEAKRKEAAARKEELAQKETKKRRTIEDKVNEALKKDIEEDRKKEEALKAKIKKRSGKSEAVESVEEPAENEATEE